jgi:hypothetical protein
LPSFVNCSPAICSPKLAPPGSTRTPSEVHVVWGGGGAAALVVGGALVGAAVREWAAVLVGGCDVAGALVVGGGDGAVLDSVVVAGVRLGMVLRTAAG